MSREYGDYIGGYFHDKIRHALDDLKDDETDKIHKQFIPLFESLYKVAYAIASVEAGDSMMDRTIITTLEEIPQMRQTLSELEESFKELL